MSQAADERRRERHRLRPRPAHDLEDVRDGNAEQPVANPHRAHFHLCSTACFFLRRGFAAPQCAVAVLMRWPPRTCSLQDSGAPVANRTTVRHPLLQQRDASGRADLVPASNRSPPAATSSTCVTAMPTCRLPSRQITTMMRASGLPGHAASSSAGILNRHKLPFEVEHRAPAGILNARNRDLLDADDTCSSGIAAWRPPRSHQQIFTRLWPLSASSLVSVAVSSSPPCAIPARCAMAPGSRIKRQVGIAEHRCPRIEPDALSAPRSEASPQSLRDRPGRRPPVRTAAHPRPERR